MCGVFWVCSLGLGFSLGFRVWGLGFGVWGLGFGVWGLGGLYPRQKPGVWASAFLTPAVPNSYSSKGTLLGQVTFIREPISTNKGNGYHWATKCLIRPPRNAPQENRDDCSSEAYD